MLLPAVTETRGEIAPLLDTIQQVDALALLRRLPDASIDMVLCDLPYGTLTHIGWDQVIDLPSMWAELDRITKKSRAIVFTSSQPFTSRLVMSRVDWFRHEWIWRKSQGTGYLNANRQPMKNHESVLVFSRESHQYFPQMREGDSYIATRGNVGGFVRDKTVGGYLTISDGSRYPLTVIDFKSARNTVHPTQKPVALFEYLIKTYTQPGEIVLDMTVGSGTTAIAAWKTGRRFICGDLSAEYVAIAKKRLADTDPYQARDMGDGTKQLSLFEGMEGA